VSMPVIASRLRRRSNLLFILSFPTWKSLPHTWCGGIQFPYLNPSHGIYPPTVTLAQPKNLLFPVILSRRRRICLPWDSSSWLEKPFLRM